MTTVEERIAGPERPGGQGLDTKQEESGNRAIVALLTDPVRGPQTDLVMTYRESPSPLSRPAGEGPGVRDQGAYEVWSKRGMVRFVRFFLPEGGYGYRVIEQVGEDPIADQDPTALSTKAEELEASARSGFSGSDQARAFIEPEQLSYPLAYERIAQLFDSPNAPDIAISQKSYAFGRQPGQHGTLDVVQSRAPLVFSGPGVTTGETDVICSHVDVTPTLAKLLGLPLIDGMDSSGRTSSERSVEPDVYLKRQDGRVIVEVLDEESASLTAHPETASLPARPEVSKDRAEPPHSRPERVYILLLDGLSNTELKERLDHDRESIPNLARLIERGVMFRYGTFATFPTITWPSHNALGTGAWCGHHDIVSPTYYLRETRQVVTPQGQIWETAGYLSEEVETLYEAVHRAYGTWNGREGVITASLNEPCGRGATHATLERRLLIDGEKMREVTGQHLSDANQRWRAEGMEQVHRYSRTDNQGLAQSLMLFDSDTQPPPIFTFHEFSLTDAVGHDYGPHHEAMRDALVETDKRIGKILSLLDQQGLFESTLFVISADHGMAQTNVELAADPAQAVLDAGLKAVVTSPLIYLLDMDVTLEPSADGRTLNITVLENDAGKSGEQPAVEGADVQVIGPHARVLAETKTDAFGVAGLPLPVGEDPASLVVRIGHERFNTRHLRLDGTNVVEDLRAALYGK